MPQSCSRLVVLAALLGATAGCPGPDAEPVDDPGSTSAVATTQSSATTTRGDPTGGSGTTFAQDGTAGTTDDGLATVGVDDTSTPPEYCPPGVEPSATLWHGVGELLPLDSGAAQVYLGHQGGYHVTLGMRAEGLDLRDWGDGRLRATVGGEVVADHPTVIVMNCDEGGEYSEALWINLIFEVDPRPLLGQVASVEAEYVDASDRVIVATAELTISDDIVPL